MAEDYVLPLRRAMLPALKHNAPLLERIPAASIYPGTVPASRTFPFARFGAVVASPFRASGLDSSSIRTSVQAFTKGVMSGKRLTASAEDEAYRLGSLIKDALDGATLTLDSGMKARLTWIQTTPMRDGEEADAWMVTVAFSAEIAG